MGNTKHALQIIDSDAHFTVDAVTRNITNDESKKNTILQGDHNSERFTFSTPRYIDGHDMLSCDNVRVAYINSETTGRNKRHCTGVYMISDLELDTSKDGYVKCSWLISKNATVYEGVLNFMLIFSCMDGDVVKYRWKTNVFENIYVAHSLDSDLIFEAEYLDVIEQWKDAVKNEFSAYLEASAQHHYGEVKDTLFEEMEAEFDAMQDNLDETFKAKSDAIDQTITAFDDILKTEITNMDGEIDTLKSRMNTFTALKEGSTTGDAELADIRVGADGNTYDSAGEAVRAQFSQMTSKMIKVACDNLLNPDTMISGYIGNTNGVITENDTYKTSDYIPVTPGDTVTYWYLSNITPKEGVLRFVTAYDENLILLPNSGYNGEGGMSNFVIPEGVAYIRVSVHASNEYPMLIRNGLVPAGYIQYFKDPYYKAGNDFVDCYTRNETRTLIAEHVVAPADTSFFDASPNIFDGAFIAGFFVNQTNGALGANETHLCSDYIPIKANTAYVISNAAGYYTAMRYAIYDINKVFIAGARDDNHIPAYENAAYIRISLINQEYAYGSLQLEEGVEPTPYRGHDEHLIPRRYLQLGEGFTLNLPDKLYALVGEELNVYFDNLVDGRDTDYVWDVTCDVGQHMERCYRLVPETAGVYSLNITATKMGVTISKNTSIIVADTTDGADVTKSVIILGDSTTNNGIAVSKLLTNFENDSMNIVSMGTRGNAPKNHEGRSGWTFKQYCTFPGDAANTDVVNPFYNPETEKFDAAYYFANSGVDVPDYFIINLGINDTFSYKSDAALMTAIETLNTQCTEMIVSIKAVDPSIKIGIALTIPPNYSQDAFGKNYKCGQNRSRYKRNNVIWVANQIEKYSNREDEGIYLIPIHTNLDTKYNMGFEVAQHNKRNPETYQEPIANGGVHPVDSGYWQIADVYWFFLKSQERTGV